MNKYRILIIDDSQTKREMVKRAIISQYDVITAASGAEGLSMLSEMQPLPDLILLDVEMPDMDGYQTMQEISMMEKVNEVPVVFLTARTDPAAELYGLSVGAVDYISVPFSPPLLLKRIELHISLVLQKRELAALNENLAGLVDERTAELNESNAKLQKALEEAEAANRTKSVFIANVSHETRTPLNSIIGFTELAKSEDIPDKVKTYLTNISESATWLLSIINDILDISVIELGKIVLDRTPFAFSEIMDFLHAKTTTGVEQKKLTLSWDANTVADKKVIADPTRLRQALMNLLSNAVKFTNEGTVHFSATVKEATAQTMKVLFTIEDTGIGFDPQIINKLYEPFNQADDTATRRYGGTGLGLTITKTIVNLMGGELSVDSTEGKGTIVTFELTFDVATEADMRKDAIVINESEMLNFEGEVLICEDNHLNQQLISDHLNRVGVTHVLADNGKEGLDIITERIQKGEKLFDLIFMDIQMPVMDGLKTVAKIIEQDIKTPIVALTANVMPDDLKLYKISGMSDAVGKPFTTHELWQCLAKYLPVKSTTAIDKKTMQAQEEKLITQLKINFYKDFKDVFAMIKGALAKEDIKTAHRLSHTLKGLAGQIGEKSLQAAALTVESALKNDHSALEDAHLILLESELADTMARIQLLAEEKAATTATATITDKETVRKLFAQLQQMLENRNPDCEDVVDSLKAIDGTADLIAQIERFKFTNALEALEKVKTKWGL